MTRKGGVHTQRSLKRGENGAALITALFILTILTLLGMMVLNTSMVEIRMASNQKRSSQAFYAAEAGLERGLDILIKDLEGKSSWANATFVGSGGNVTATAVNGSTAFDVSVRSVDMYRDGDSASGVKRLSFANGGTSLGSMNYEVFLYTPKSTEAYIFAYATGDVGNAAVEYHLETSDYSPYNNVFYSGSKLKISGHDHHGNGARVAGSMYVNGKLEIKKEVLIANNYDDVIRNEDLRGLLPAADGTDLGTQIHVKGGEMKIDDSVEFGTSSTDPKGSLAGINADGDIDMGSGTNYVDAISAEVPNVPFPSILEGIIEEFGAGILAESEYAAISKNEEKAEAIYEDWINGTDYFAQASTVNTSGVVIDGGLPHCDEDDDDEDDDYHDDHDHHDLKIKECTASFSVTDSLGNGVVYDSTTKHLQIIGNILVKGKMEIKTDITYSSMGAFVDDGSGNPVAPTGQNEMSALIINTKKAKFKASFHPPLDSGYLKGGDNTNAIGIMTLKDKIEFKGRHDDHEDHHGASPDPVITGFFYSPKEVKFKKSINFAGTAIGGKVEWKEHDHDDDDVPAPALVQVPALANYLPLGMPGSKSYASFSGREWRRVN